MEDVLLQMVWRVIPSSSGKTQYTIETIDPGLTDTVAGAGRRQSSVLS
jgi:hypothetical protein